MPAPKLIVVLIVSFYKGRRGASGLWGTSGRLLRPNRQKCDVEITRRVLNTLRKPIDAKLTDSLLHSALFVLY